MTKVNKSWIHRATKKRIDNYDFDKITPIQMALLKYNIPTVRERTIYNGNFSQMNHVRNPDLTDTRFGIILEHDTNKIHGDLSEPNGRTIKRNCDFARAGLTYAVINADLAKELDLDESKLAIYLFYHKFMELKINTIVKYGAWDKPT